MRTDQTTSCSAQPANLPVRLHSTPKTVECSRSRDLVQACIHDRKLITRMPTAPLSTTTPSRTTERPSSTNSGPSPPHSPAASWPSHRPYVCAPTSQRHSVTFTSCTPQSQLFGLPYRTAEPPALAKTSQTSRVPSLLLRFHHPCRKGKK